MKEMINPYIAGAPVAEARMFFGREDVFEWIQNSISGRYAEHILVIHGQRRVGKTSILKQLGNHLPRRYVPVFFDLQGRTHTSLDRFLWWLAREIARVLKQDRGIEVPQPEKEAFTADADYFENHFLPHLLPALGENTLLLTFDEFDNLEEAGVKQALAGPLIDHLQRLMGREGLSFIFSVGSSGRKLENMRASYTMFFKTALYKKISFLSREDTHHLIALPVTGLVKYDREAIDRIYEITYGYPYFTQLMCHELFGRCQKTGQRKVTEEDVEAVLDDVVERGTVNLKSVWDEASDLEKWVLAAMAHLGASDSRELAAFLRGQRLRFSEGDLTSALLHLREKEILTEDNRFVVYLLRLWLKCNRSIERVREELIEVNPIANRYMEIGLEYKDKGEFAQAIESFLKVLAIIPEHLPARVSLAQVYAAQKAYEKAAAEFEKALATDEEDVAARAGLCAVHLALGDLALSRGQTREARRSYERVLSINPEHAEAGQQMAEVEHFERTQTLMQAYVDAQAALAHKDYNRAVELLQWIVARDKEYKDAALLLAQAAKLRRAPRMPAGKGAWLWAGAAALAVVVIAIICLASPLMVTMFAPEATPRPTSTPYPKPTPLPTYTSYPLPEESLSSQGLIPLSSDVRGFLDSLAAAFEQQGWIVTRELDKSIIVVQHNLNSLRFIVTYSPDSTCGHLFFTATFGLKDGVAAQAALQRINEANTNYEKQVSIFLDEEGDVWFQSTYAFTGALDADAAIRYMDWNEENVMSIALTFADILE